MPIRSSEINLIEARKVADQKGVYTPTIQLNNIALQDGGKFVLRETEAISDRLRSRFEFSTQVGIFVETSQKSLKRAATFHGMSSTRPMPVFQLRTGS
jgi:hypothetical protein